MSVAFIQHRTDGHVCVCVCKLDNTETSTYAKHPKIETDEGTALVKAFLEEWKERVESKGDISEEEQVVVLRAVAEEYRQRFEGNAWVRGLMSAF
jgi:DNA mismatch repair protein MSH2